MRIAAFEVRSQECRIQTMVPMSAAAVGSDAHMQ